MAGHSKWANIKHRKGAQDAKRGKIFTKLIRELTVAAKGGSDPNCNPRLRLAIDKALSNNMTRDTVDRAVKRGAGEGDDQNLEELTYEGYGPGGLAVYVHCMTDNRNRTVSDVRHAFTKFGGNLGTDGSVSYLFQRCGQILFDTDADEDQVTELAIELGADDVLVEPEGIEVRTSYEDFLAIKEGMEKAGLTPMNAESTYIPETVLELGDDQVETVQKLIDRLEDLDDVQEVYTNLA